MLPLGGCLARQELTQLLGSDPLPCQVCFQQAREGKEPSSLSSWDQFTAAAVVPVPCHLRCARHCCWTLPELQKKQDAQAWDMGWFLYRTLCVLKHPFLAQISQQSPGVTWHRYSPGQEVPGSALSHHRQQTTLLLQWISTLKSPFPLIPPAEALMSLRL